MSIRGLSYGIGVRTDELGSDRCEDIVLHILAKDANGGNSECIEVVLESDIAVVGGCRLQSGVAFGDSQVRHGLIHERRKVAVVGPCERARETRTENRIVGE